MARELASRGGCVSALDLNFDEDAHQLPFPDNCFDWIVSFDAMEHLADLPKFLCEARRVLIPDGLTAFEIPNKPVSRLWEKTKGNSFKLQQEYHPSVQTYWGLQKLFKQAGFARLQFFKMPFMDGKAQDEIRITVLAPTLGLLQCIPWGRWPQPLYPMFHVLTQKRN